MFGFVVGRSLRPLGPVSRVRVTACKKERKLTNRLTSTQQMGGSMFSETSVTVDFHKVSTAEFWVYVSILSGRESLRCYMYCWFISVLLR